MRWAGMGGFSPGDAGDAGEPRVCALELVENIPWQGAGWVLQGAGSGLLDQNHFFLQQNPAEGMCWLQKIPLGELLSLRQSWFCQLEPVMAWQPRAGMGLVGATGRMLRCCTKITSFCSKNAPGGTHKSQKFPAFKPKEPVPVSQPRCH